MKLSRNVLVGSLAVSGMVLGAIAPALTAQAATTTGAIDDKGNVTYTPSKNIGNLNNPDGGQLAIAYDDSTGANGEATAISNASVKVVSGVLVLNQVPDFNFGSAVAGQTKNLVDNTKDSTTAQGQDGNAKGELSVLESRDLSKATGFNLQAQLGNFVDASTKATQTLTTTPFTLNLAAQEITDGQNPITGLKTNAVALKSAGSADTVMNVSKDANGASYKDGEYLATFKAADGTNDAGASLLIPGDIPAASTGKVSTLNAPITWTLTTKPSATTGTETPETGK